MSLDATNWAWRVELKEKKGGCRLPLKRLVLLSLADRAGEDHTCYPSMKRLENDTQIERKTVLKIIAELIQDGLIADTGERKGVTKQVKVYKLIGINGRETVPKVEQFQQRNSSNNGIPNSPNNGTLNSAVNGTQNLPKNLPIESKNKNHWLCSKKLSLEIAQANPEIDTNEIISSTWFSRELRAFELFNAEKSMCDELMIYHFANWLLEAKAKQDRLKHTSQPIQKQPAKSKNTLTDKQRHFFASKLSRLPEFAKYSVGNESYEQLAKRLEPMLKDPENLKKWAEYLINISNEHKGNAV
ncbi:helix-turn-helix domain-containing protein [Acinetobacter courvalinii]|uniref:helix-turn-helix domain-containing protein n=1 Tax=Acinetobacter courvalinii TaxID=280147 RepID=UPI0021D15540|nr:helix-turn-helix domain-containing protein [Acinetobacter courvalinii]MCU4576038.1 helix-turn-helix domain-containing protein [Acinetobacter courvalinii]